MSRRFLIVAMLAGALALAACTDSGDIRDLAGAGAGASGSPTPTDSPTVTPDISTEMQSQPPAPIIEVTRIVEVQIIITPPPGGGTVTPDVAGFPSAAGIDESVQPCPARYWRHRRCTATQAQIDAASEAQP